MTELGNTDKVKMHKCRYCSKKYKRWGKWFFRHFERKHPGEKVACVTVYVKRKR